MSDEKKPTRHYEAVFARTLDETANALNIVVNRLIDKGYEVQVEPKQLPPEQGFGYMIHAILRTEEGDEVPKVVVVPTEMMADLRETLEKETSGSPLVHLSLKAKKVMYTLFGSMSITSWEVAEKEVVKLFPSAIHGMSAEDLRGIREEFTRALTAHDMTHADPESCAVHRTFTVILGLLQENLRSSIQ